MTSLPIAIIIAHNHLSGNFKSSKIDEVLTQKLKNAAALFDIKLLDHIIIKTDNEFYSFMDDGIL
jgi:DNA repair protein RadC